MSKELRRKVMIVMAGAMIFGGTGLLAGMNCGSGKCGSGMKMEMKDDAKMKEMPCGCKKGECACCDKKEGMKHGGDEGMKSEMKSEMKGKCAPGKCGGM